MMIDQAISTKTTNQVYVVSNLEDYTRECAPFSVIYTHLTELGLATKPLSPTITMHDFINSYFQYHTQHLNKTPVELLMMPLVNPTIEINLYPSAFKALNEKLDLYLKMICDVLYNQLSDRPYEYLCDKENVTENEHALQSAKIANALGMHNEDVIALLLHDIARPSVNDPLHGHKNHCKEGSIILAPLNLETDYTRYHALAKYLLYRFCPLYKELISHVSQYSLAIQEKHLAEPLLYLNEQDNHSIAHFIYKIMFMRLIDDMSKVPGYLLENSHKDKSQIYISIDDIKQMLQNQMSKQLHHLSRSSNQLDINIFLEKKLDDAIMLLVRAKDYSYNKDIYDYINKS